mmetsp:Transcript_80369/g.239397  ORF Transcript_80369/g.239397 Transcript_80369/m.239397 type:complete len:301 (-) Transcript_80369:156-1058(-)
MGDDARIWIGGLPDGIEEQEIKEEYDRFGEIKHVHIRCNKGSPAFAFVQYLDRRNAEDAVKSTDQAKLFGMPFVKVSWAGKGASRKGKGKGNRSRTPPRRSRSPRRRSPDRRRDSRPPARSPPPQRGDSRRRPRSPPPQRADSRARPRSPPPQRRDSRQRQRSPPPRRDPSRENGGRREFRDERPPADCRSRSPRRQPSYGRRSRSPPGGRQPKPSELQGKYRVKIEKLPEDMGWQELKGLGVTFAKHGQCTFARTLRDRTGVLEFTSVRDMNLAIDELDGRRFSGSETRLIAFEDKGRR